MQGEFERTALLIGEENINKLGEKHVAVFGVGGVGGYVVECLVRSGVGAITLVDFDKVEKSNINRQIIATHGTIGQNKVDAAARRAKEINPDVKVNAICDKYVPEMLDNGYDYIIDAIDDVKAKIDMIERALEKGISIISSMGAGNKLDPTRFEVADISRTSHCPLARVARRELKSRGIERHKVVYSQEEAIKVEGNVVGSIAFVPAAAGLVLAAEVIKDLIK